MIGFKLKDGGVLPVKGSKYAAGYDIATNEDVELAIFERKLIKTGVYLTACPSDTYLRVAPRSKIAVKLSVDIGAGVVDSDYRGEIRVLLVNHGTEPVSFNKGDKIAQLIPERISEHLVVELDESEESERGESGVNDKEMRL